jgi:acyl carrier protein
LPAGTKIAWNHAFPVGAMLRPNLREMILELQDQVREILRDVLSLNARADRLGADSALLGAVPELDSMAVVNVIAALEDRFGFVVDDDEISGATFATFGSLVQFVSSKTAPTP